MRVKLRTEKLLPTSFMPMTDISWTDPIAIIPVIDRDDPKRANERSEHVEPKVANEQTETAEPQRAKERTLIEDAKCTKLNTDSIPEVVTRWPAKEIPEPRRENERSENPLPM
jgi:hypothetical protein